MLYFPLQITDAAACTFSVPVRSFPGPDQSGGSLTALAREERASEGGEEGDVGEGDRACGLSAMEFCLYVIRLKGPAARALLLDLISVPCYLLPLVCMRNVCCFYLNQ